MKKNTIFLFLMCLTALVRAQNVNTKKADILFDRYEFIQAAQEYLVVLKETKSDGYIVKQLGDCYYNMENSAEAEKWYALAIESNKSPDLLYRYAQVLKSNGRYAEANQQMAKFVELVPNDERAKSFMSDPDYLEELNKIEKKFDIKVMDINSDKTDFGALLHGDDLYFASSRSDRKKMYGWNNEPFLDIYKSKRNSDGNFSEPLSVSELNTVYHEGPVAISDDGNVIYFSSESYNEKMFEKDKTKRLKFGQVSLYKATKLDGKWQNITPLPFNGKNYSTGNPTISKDGKTLYFSSNRPGSIGGTDIWKVSVNDDGTFSSPENLGDKINTVGDENFPFITEDSILYFSSNGQVGFGGLDVFSADLKLNTKSENLGKPINSEKDDFAFTFNSVKNIGFLSSNRLGKDNLYSTTPICKAQIETIVKNSKTGELIANAKVTLFDEFGKSIIVESSDSKGEILFDVDCNKLYQIEIQKDGFVTKKFTIDPIPGGKKVLNGEIEPVDVIVTETEIILKPIYFEFDKSNITPQGAAELDKLIYVMSQNNKLVIYAKSHTDSRGSDKYNLELSDRRAKSTVAYIISKGIPSERISGEGFGEKEPKVNCNKCTEEENALNRRSEFKIVK